MKRIAPMVIVSLLLTIFVVWYREYTSWFPVARVSQYWILFGISWLVGIAVSLAVAFGFTKIKKLNGRPWTDQDLRVAIFGVLFSSLFFGFEFLTLIGKALSKFLFEDPSTIVRMHVAHTYSMYLSWCILGGLLYLFYRIAERTRYRRVSFETGKRERKQTFLLISKLSVAGGVILILTMFVGNTELSQRMQFGLLDRRWNTEKDSVVRCLSFENRGISHRAYLKAMVEICRNLRNAGVKVVVVPLPASLINRQAHVQLVQEMVDFGNVVFAISPDEQRFPELVVDHPLENKLPMNWGVITPRSWQSGWWTSFKYYPLSYLDPITRSLTPDVAVVTVKHFLGEASGPNPAIDGRKFTLGLYQTGLLNDGGAFIQHRIYPFFPFQFFAKADEESDKVQFAVSGPEMPSVSNPPQSVWRLLEGKIVLIEPGEQITNTPNFAWTYGNIIHNILSGEGTKPIDILTPVITGFMLLIVACVIFVLRPWLGLASIVGLIIGQWYLYSWLASSYAIGMEPVPPIMGSILGLFVFSFVLIDDERKRMDGYEKKRMLEELKTAHDMQMGLMPTEDPRIPGYEISGISKPADEVGGDFFDYVWLDDRKSRLGIAIGDVSGKAMKAAITAVMTSGMVYREVGTNETPKSILRKINKPMYLKTERRIFTAMSFAVIDLRKKKMAFSNAGQMQPLLKRGETMQSIKVGGTHLPLGMTEDAEYTETNLQFRKGDMLIFYTDGVPEAMNGKNELFGFERLESIVKTSGVHLSAKQVAANIVERVAEFTGSTKQHDDMTIVVVRVL